MYAACTSCGFGAAPRVTTMRRGGIPQGRRGGGGFIYTSSYEQFTQWMGQLRQQLNAVGNPGRFDINRQDNVTADGIPYSVSEYMIDTTQGRKYAAYSKETFYPDGIRFDGGVNFGVVAESASTVQPIRRMPLRGFGQAVGEVVAEGYANAYFATLDEAEAFRTSTISQLEMAGVTVQASSIQEVQGVWIVYFSLLGPPDQMPNLVRGSAQIGTEGGVSGEKKTGALPIILGAGAAVGLTVLIIAMAGK